MFVATLGAALIAVATFEVGLLSIFLLTPSVWASRHVLSCVESGSSSLPTLYVALLAFGGHFVSFFSVISSGVLWFDVATRVGLYGLRFLRLPNDCYHDARRGVSRIHDTSLVSA